MALLVNSPLIRFPLQSQSKEHRLIKHIHSNNGVCSSDDRSLKIIPIQKSTMTPQIIIVITDSNLGLFFNRNELNSKNTACEIITQVPNVKPVFSNLIKQHLAVLHLHLTLIET